MRRILLAIFVVLAAQGAAFGQERILRYVSDIVVQRNGDLDVTETVTVLTELEQIRRGIYRNLVTDFTNASGAPMGAGIQVISVTRNNKPENFVIEAVDKGIRIRIGNADVMLTKGEHTYVVRYRATKFVDFHESFDELIWPAVGNWAFQIDVAEARVTLPDGAEIKERYSLTGESGSDTTNAKIIEESRNRVVWRTAGPLRKSEHLTVSVAWQKGIVARQSN